MGPKVIGKLDLPTGHVLQPVEFNLGAETE